MNIRSTSMFKYPNVAKHLSLSPSWPMMLLSQAADKAPNQYFLCVPGF